MGDTGSTSLGATLAVVALMTNAALILPIVCVVYVMESLSVAVQLTSKKDFQEKNFPLYADSSSFRGDRLAGNKSDDACLDFDRRCCWNGSRDRNIGNGEIIKLKI